MTEPMLPVVQMSSTLQAAAASGDDSAWQEAIAAGYRMIDKMYRPHPVKRPMDVIRRRQAQRWWQEEVERTSARLGAAMMDYEVRRFTTRLNRPLDQEDFDYHEGNRKQQVTFDINEQIRLEQARASAQAKAQIAVEQVKVGLNPTPNSTAEIDAVMARMDAIEQDPNLTEEQKQRRLALLQRMYESSGGR
jgi:hypothetical protein